MFGVHSPHNFYKKPRPKNVQDLRVYYRFPPGLGVGLNPQLLEGFACSEMAQMRRGAEGNHFQHVGHPLHRRVLESTSGVHEEPHRSGEAAFVAADDLQAILQLRKLEIRLMENF